MNWKQRLADQVLPVVVIIACVFLMATGINGEVKAIFGMAAAWAFRAAISKPK